MFCTPKDVSGGRDIIRFDVVICVVGDIIVVVGMFVTDAIVFVVINSSDSIEATVVSRVSVVVISVEIRFSLILIAGIVVSGIDPTVVASSVRDGDFVDIVGRVVVVIVDVDVILSVVDSIDEGKMVVVSTSGNSEDVIRVLVMIVSVDCSD